MFWIRTRNRTQTFWTRKSQDSSSEKDDLNGRSMLSQDFSSRDKTEISSFQNHWDLTKSTNSWQDQIFKSLDFEGKRRQESQSLTKEFKSSRQEIFESEILKTRKVRVDNLSGLDSSRRSSIPTIGIIIEKRWNRNMPKYEQLVPYSCYKEISK